jgi:hypothetical protein
MGERGLKGHSLAPFCLLAFISLRNPWEEITKPDGVPSYGSVGHFFTKDGPRRLLTNQQVREKHAGMWRVGSNPY